MGVNPHEVTRRLEKALCDYAGSPYAVATTSCTAALLLSVAYCLRQGLGAYEGGEGPFVEIPKRTYVGVGMSILHAGGKPAFRDEAWIGYYQLKPLPVWDSARNFTSLMYQKIAQRVDREKALTIIGGMVCVSFHAAKILSDTQGGAILHDSPEADGWLRKMRFDGRTEGVAPKDDRFDTPGWHAYLSPDVAARLLWKLSLLPERNEPLPNDAYPDLSLAPVFK